MRAEASRRLELHLSYDCGQRCVFCSESGRMARYRRRPPTAAEIARVLVAKRRQGFDHLTLTGGEPAEHPAFLGVLAAARKLGYRTYATSNGSRLADPAFARRALPLLDELCLSIHGDDAATHDACARRPGSFREVCGALVLAREAPRLYVLTNTVVTTKNEHRVPALVARLASLPGVRHCLLSNAAPEGRAGAAYRRLAVPLSRWKLLAPVAAAAANGSSLVLRFFGLPLCVLGEHASLSNDLFWSPRATVERAGPPDSPRLVEIPGEAPTRRRVKTEACRACSVAAQCGGVFDRYVELFGAAELKPVPGGAA